MKLFDALSVKDIVVLLTIYKNQKGLNIKRISEKLSGHYNWRTIKRALANLEELGLVWYEKRKITAVAIEKVYTLTEKGKRVGKVLLEVEKVEI
ncbi:MAG: hypothetical protein J7L47_01775 [Candidatus Odinarchaeota archaeon]|nr:hypothetical protein [Candidatus Odinarchaeota archaeon]